MLWIGVMFPRTPPFCGNPYTVEGIILRVVPKEELVAGRMHRCSFMWPKTCNMPAKRPLFSVKLNHAIAGGKSE
jgi:hypothetical protein